MPSLHFKRIAAGLLSLGVLTGAFILLHRNVQNISFKSVLEAAHNTPLRHILLSLLATFISFSALAMQERIAARAVITHPLPARMAVLAGAMGNAFGNTLGFHAITITAWRYRIYAKAGISIPDIARISGIVLIGMSLAFGSTLAMALVGDRDPINVSVTVGSSALHLFGFILITIIAVVLCISRKRKQLRFRSFTFLLPDSGILATQMVVGVIEMSAAVYACYILFPAHGSPSFAHFTVFYIAAILFGVASQAPGGIGVFEASMIAALTEEARADIIASLLLYRLIYNLLPFCIASISAGVLMVKQRSIR